MYLIHVTPHEYQLLNPDGTVFANFPRTEDDEDDQDEDTAYDAARDLQDLMNDFLHL